MATIPASQIINVVPSVLSAGGAAIDLNGLVLTDNTRVPIGTVQSFASATAVETFFGAGSAEDNGAAVYFGGFDGSTAKPGALLFAQYPTASVSAYLRGASVAALALATLQGYSGTLNVTIDSVLKTASINLSAATSFSNAAEIIAQGLAITGVVDGVGTGSIGGTLTCTSSGTTLNVTAVLTGTLQPGAHVSGTDTTNSLPGGCTIISQLTGTAGGVGTYLLSAAATPGNLTSCTVTASSDVLVVTAIGSGQFGVADVISGGSIASGTYIAAIQSGLGGIGRYQISSAQTIASTAVTARKPAVQYDSVSGAFVVVSGTAGASSTITFGSGALADSLLLTAAAGAVLSQGAAAATPAAFMNAAIAITQNWATFMTTFDPDAGSGNAQKLLFSGWVNGKLNRYAYVAWDADPAPTLAVPATASLGYKLQQGNYSGTILVYGAAGLNLAWFICGWAASINFTQPSGRTTLAFRSQAGLAASVTDAAVAINLGGNPQVVADRGNGYNFYGAYATGNADFTFMSRGFVSGGFLWADSFVNQIWLNNSLQVALLSFMTAIGAVPFNAAGRASIEQALADPIQAGLDFGAFVPGVVLSSAQILQVNTVAGADIATTLQARGWYLQIRTASASVRASRGPLQVIFWYCDGQSVQSINLGSIAVQ